MLTNDIVSFEQMGPGCHHSFRLEVESSYFYYCSTKHILQYSLEALGESGGGGDTLGVIMVEVSKPVFRNLLH